MGCKKLAPSDWTELVVQAIIDGKEKLKDFEFTVKSYGKDSQKILAKVRKRLKELNYEF